MSKRSSSAQNYDEGHREESPLSTRRDAEVTAPQPHSVGSNLLTRKQAAQVLGVSVSTLIRREGELKPTVVKGVHMFDEQVVRREVTTIRHRRSITSLGPTTGDVAASVFGLLESGVGPIQIVIQLRVAPDVVDALRTQWLDMAKGSACSKCGEPRTVMCRACLIEALEQPCPTCVRKCGKCGHPLGKGKLCARSVGRGIRKREGYPRILWPQHS